MKTKVLISLCSSSAPGKRQRIFHEDSRECDTPAEALEWLERNYGIRKPARLRPSQRVYVGGLADGPAIPCGFIVQRWNRYDDNPRKSYWEQVWVTFSSVQSTPFLP